MTTAWPLPRARGSRRPGAAAPRRLPWLLAAGLTLLALLFTHAADPGAASGHLTGSAAVQADWAAAAAPCSHRSDAGKPAPDDGGHGSRHGAVHTAESCALATPPPSPELAPPPVALPGLPAVLLPRPAPVAHVPAATGGFVMPIPHAAQSAVVRV